MSIFLQAIISGLAIGAVYALVAMGYNAIYAATRVFNLAQAQVVMVAIMVTWWLRQEQGWETAPAILAAIGISILVSVAIEGICVSLIRIPRGEANPIDQMALVALVTTLGASIVIQNGAVMLFGSGVSPFSPYLPARGYRLGGATVSPQQILMVATAGAVALAYQTYMRRAPWGLRLHAMAEDIEAAAYRGVRIRQGRTIAFGIAGLIAGIGGVVVGPIAFADPTVGFQFGLSGFVALAIGGFGTRSGPLLGAMLLGISEALVAGYVNGQYRIFVDLGLLLLVLLVRPQGLASTPSVRRM